MADKSLLTAQEKDKLAELRAIRLRDYNELTEEQLKMMDELQDKEKGLVDSSESRIKSLTRQNDLLAKQIERNEILIKQGETVVGHYETKLEQQKNALELEKEQLNINAENYDTEVLRLNTELQKLDAKKKGYADSENAAKRFLGITREPASGIGKFLVDPLSYTQGMTSGLGEVVDGMSIMTSTIDKVVEATAALAIEQDAAISSFRKATGATGDFDADIVRLERDLFAAGVTSAEAAESVQELYLNVSGFSQSSKEDRKEMSHMVAVLAEVGVAAADSTKNIQIAIKGLGMSNTEATVLQSRLRSFAQGINVSTGQMAKDFGEMGPQIVAMGDKGEAAFEKLQVTMKETGLEMSTVLKLVEQFDTFEGAATQVGKLNALMGGPFLNTLDLVSETDLGARMEKLRDGVMEAGVSFESLDYYQKKAYTSALGLNSEMELAMFLGNNMDQIVPEEKTAEEWEEIAKQTAEFNTVMDELMQVGRSLAISIRPFVTTLKAFFEILQVIGPGLSFLIVSMGTFRTIMMTGTAINNLWIGSQITGIGVTRTRTFLTALNTKVLGFFTTALGLSTTATWAQVAASMALIGAFALIGYMLYVAIASPGLIAILTFLTVAMFGLLFATNVLGWTLGPLIPILYAFGGAILLVGLGVGIAGAGMSLFVDSIAGLAGLHGDIFKTALAILAVAAALDEIPMTKTVALSTVLLPLAAMAPVAMVAAAGAGAVARGAGGAAAPAAAAGYTGPPPVINVRLEIDGDEFSTSVNKVKVEKYVGGAPSNAFESIVDMIKEGFLSSS